MGQGVMQPLGIQGIEQREIMSARARGMGAVVAALPAGAESAVLNPAGLASLEHLSVSVGGLWRAIDWAETQHWNPNRYYAGISLYFADPAAYQTEPFASPDWTHRQTTTQLSALSGAMPFRWRDRRMAVALAYHTVAHLDDFDRNDNVLDPYIGQFRPEPVERPRPGEEIKVRWSAFERERTGHMQAATVAIGVALTSHLHVGVRVSRASGSSEDRQHLRDRGMFLLREDAHDYSFESLDGIGSLEGTSEFSAMSGALGLQWEHNVLRAGVIVELPHSITHSFKYRDAGSSTTSRAGASEIDVPARVIAGAALRPTARAVLAVDYFWQDFTALESSGAAPDWGRTHGIGLGLEWRLGPDTHARAGFRRDPKPFRIEGSGLLGETATGDAYSAGLGQAMGPVELNVSYEVQLLTYQDRWESNVDYNRIRRHNVLFGASYRL